MVKQFYRDVARLPPINDQDMCVAMTQLSIQQTDEFDTIAALKELYIYVTKYNDQVDIFLNYVVICCIVLYFSYFTCFCMYRL